MQMQPPVADLFKRAGLLLQSSNHLLENVDISAYAKHLLISVSQIKTPEWDLFSECSV